MTVVVEEIQTTPVIQQSSQNSLASWHIRVGAFAVDVLPGMAVAITMASAAIAKIRMFSSPQCFCRKYRRASYAAQRAGHNRDGR